MIAGSVAALAAAVLGYGAWHAHTHASVWLTLNDQAGRTPQRRWADVNDARLALRDAAGSVLAEAVLEPPQGLPRWTGPSGAVVDCRPSLSRDEWQRCYPVQSRWMAQWAPRVDHATVSVGACRVERVPVQRHASSDWWLWWVPLPHVGGKPTSHHALSLHLDSARCIAVAPQP